MKLAESNYGFESVLPEERIAFTIENSAKLFGILSNGIYKDKILAVIRELSCNAHDAHIEGKKKHVPFKIKLPTRLDPVFYVEDEGTGIDPTQIGKIYWTYGRSSKTDSNDQIGALGLGSKSPFAYTQSSFVVKNRYEGREYTYLCFINEEGKPDGSKVSEELTDKPSGVTVEFAVRLEDITVFHDRTKRFFKRWSSTLPIFVDLKTEHVIGNPIEKVIEGTDWYLEKTNHNVYSDHQGAIALQGNVPYPIEVDSIPNMPKDLRLIAINPFIITFDMGEINFSASRESLQYDERTCNNIIARLQEVRQELETSFKAKVFKTGMTHIEFINNFSRTFREFVSTIKYSHSNGSVDTNTWYANLLLCKKKTDTVMYDSISWEIDQLISGVIKLDVPKHQVFGIYRIEHRSSRTSRMFMKKYSSLMYTTLEEIEGTLIHPSWNTTSIIKKDDCLRFDWTDPSVPKRCAMTDYFRVIQNAHRFKAETQHTLPINGFDNVTFYVNDVGNSGEARYKALNEHDSFFINFDQKVSSLEEVISQLKDLVDQGLKGSKIELISGQPDNRLIIDKVKQEAGTIRLKYRQLIFEKSASSMTVYSNYSSYMSVNVNVKEVHTTRNGESILKISDLQAEQIVPYIIKHRSPTKIYDDNDVNSIALDHQIMALSSAYIFPELIQPAVGVLKNLEGRDSIRLLVLNEGKIEWLKKRKVNLVSIRTLITDRITEMKSAEKFCDKIEDSLALQEIPSVNGIHDSVFHFKDELNRLITNSSGSLFKEIFINLRKIKANNDALSEQYAKMKILEAVTGKQNLDRHASVNLTADLNKKYPLLRMMKIDRYLLKDDVHEIINYIEQVDAT